MQAGDPDTVESAEAEADTSAADTHTADEDSASKLVVSGELTLVCEKPATYQAT